MQHVPSISGIGAFLRLTRKSKGISQAEVGRRAGIRQATVSKIENDGHGVSLDTLFRVLDVLDLSLFLDAKTRALAWKEEW